MVKKSATKESKKDQAVPLTLRTQSFFLKLRGCLDGLVDAYCSLTKIESGQARDLVSADHDRPRMAGEDRQRLEFGESGRHFAGLFTRCSRFVDLRRNGAEICKEPRQRGATIGRRGRENHAGSVVVHPGSLCLARLSGDFDTSGRHP